MLRMLTLLLSVVLVGLVLPAGAQPAAGADGRTVQSVRNTARPLLVFAPSSDDLRYRAMVAFVIAHTPELLERQVVVFSFTRQGDRPGLDTRVWESTAPGQASQRRRFGIAPGQYRVLLLGKDGNRKKSWAANPSIDELNALIDAMPMRQDEIRAQQNHEP